MNQLFKALKSSCKTVHINLKCLFFSLPSKNVFSEANIFDGKIVISVRISPEIEPVAWISKLFTYNLVGCNRAQKSQSLYINGNSVSVWCRTKYQSSSHQHLEIAIFSCVLGNCPYLINEENNYK